jgi:hypothetical protein
VWERFFFSALPLAKLKIFVGILPEIRFMAEQAVEVMIP